MSFPESTTYHDQAAVDGTTAEAEDVLKPDRQLDAAIGLLHTQTDATLNANGTVKSGAYVLANLSIAELLKMWAPNIDNYLYNRARNAAGVTTGASILWPDGSNGTFTATTVNATWNAVDAFTAYHANSSKTLTQSAITRDTSGFPLTHPAPTVAP